MTSVLDAMTAETTQRKANEGASLTPVGLEKPRIPDVTGGVFLANEAVADIAKDLRRQAAVLIEVAEGLEASSGTGRPEAAIAVDIKLMEREADRQAADRAKAEAGDQRAAARDAQVDTAAFAERWATLSAEAQAAALGGDMAPAAQEVFADDIVSGDAPAPEVVASGSVVPGWECPTHGAEALKDTESKSGRKYRVCTICKQFEK